MEITKSNVKESEVEQLIYEATKLRNELEQLEERIVNCINNSNESEPWADNAPGCNDDIH